MGWNSEGSSRERSSSSSNRGHTGLETFLLLMNGASIEALTDDNFTPLHCAVLEGHAGVVKVLTTEGASIEAVNEKGNTQLRLAAVLLLHNQALTPGSGV